MPAAGEPVMENLSVYLPPSARMDEDAPEGWMFLDYQDDGRILTLGRNEFEAAYRPDPDDQG